MGVFLQVILVLLALAAPGGFFALGWWYGRKKYKERKDEN